MTLVHTVVLSRGEALVVRFEDMSELDLTMPYEYILEAALQVKLQELHKAKYQNQQADMGLNTASQFVGGQLPEKKW
jgi:hypothetical protein